jgi:hypothetical protein
MINQIDINMPLKESFKNSGLRTFLSLGLENIIPDDYIGILETIQYADLLYTTFLDDDFSRTSFDRDVSDYLDSYAKNDTTINSIVQSNNLIIEDSLLLDDIQGISSRNLVLSEIEKYTHDEVKENIEIIANKYSVTNIELIDYIVDNYVESISNNIINKNYGLPALGDIVSASSIEIENAIRNTFINGLNRSVNENIIPEYIIKPTSDIKSTDYLINIKNNIDKRKKLQSSGSVVSSNIDEINSFLNSVIYDKNKTIDNLEQDLELLLNE